MLGELHSSHLNFYALPLEQSFVPKKKDKNNWCGTSANRLAKAFADGWLHSN